MPSSTPSPAPGRSRPIRVVFVVHNAFSMTGGVQRYLLHCLDGLGRYGLEPLVVSPRGSGPARDGLLEKYPGQIVECPGPSGGQANGAGRPGSLGYVGSLATQWVRRARTRARLFRTVSGLRPDVVVLNDSWYLELARRLRRRCPVVGIWHTTKLSGGYFRAVAQHGRHLSALVGVSAATSATVVAVGGEALAPRTLTIPYGVNGDDTTYTPHHLGPHRPIRVAYVGRFVERQKRVSDLPKVMNALRQLGGRFEMTLVGDGVDLPRTVAAFEQLGLACRVTGPIEHDRVLRVWETHDVMLLPSNHEGLPLTLLEAMGRGCVPVVSRSVGGVTEVVRDDVNGLTFPVGDVSMAAAHLLRLSRDPDLHARLSRRAWEDSRHYTVTRMLGSYATLLHRVSARHPARWSRRP